MANKVDIKQKYKQTLLNLRHRPKYINLPILEVILKNLDTGNTDIKAREFKIDTGADISVINGVYKTLIENLKPVDELYLKYGGGSGKYYPVYRLGIIVKGKELQILAVYDEQCPYLLLGHYEFMENMTYNLFHSTRKESRLVLS